MPRYLSGLMHNWPEAARLCPIKGLYPDKYVLFGQKMAVCLGRLYERTHRLPVLKAGLRIRIHFIRIQIQHFRLNTNTDPGL
jgi:hypothetical protein